MITRCPWAKSEPMIAYHDREWGVPIHDDRKLFEAIVLDGAQAGLSWQCILLKRDNYRAAFDGFDVEKVARFDARRIKKLLADPGIVRNKLKIASAVGNAKATLRVQEKYGSLDKFMWQFVGGKPIVNAWSHIKRVPAKTKESEAMSRALLGEGFRFVGPTICYALMQAVGMVNDHLVDCHRHSKV
jgi:DNA-3-methyladenine glycosylase I